MNLNDIVLVRDNDKGTETNMLMKVIWFSFLHSAGNQIVVLPSKTAKGHW